MAKAKTLVPRHGYGYGLLGVVALAALFRCWQLTSLPPGLASGEASLGLAAYNLVHHGLWPNFSTPSGGSPLLVWLEAVMVRLFGITPWILRLVPALLGVIATYVVYRWADGWFGRRTALITALLLAVTPWSVTLSRNVEPAALAPLLLSLLLWLGTRLWQRRSLAAAAWLTLVAALAAVAGPVGWGALLVALAAAMATVINHKRRLSMKAAALWFALALIALLPAWLIWFNSHGPMRPLVQFGSPGDAFSGAVATLLAFHVSGDANYLHNLGGEPLLNVFVGIMLIAGILVAITHWKRRPDRGLLVAAAMALIPALLSVPSAPNAAHLVLCLPLVLALAAIGIGYMLELWYTTFPINSAARLTGQTAIILLLTLTVYQGYTQYFVAWANSSSTHRVYGDTAIGMADWIKHLPAAPKAVVEVRADEQPTLEYSLLDHPGYEVVSIAQLASKLAARPLHLVITLSLRDQTVSVLKTAAPGGSLQVHQSSFDQADLFYTYDLP